MKFAKKYGQEKMELIWKVYIRIIAHKNPHIKSKYTVSIYQWNDVKEKLLYLDGCMI